MITPARVAAAAVIGVLALGGTFFVLRPGGSPVVGPGRHRCRPHRRLPARLRSPTPMPPSDGGRYVTTPFDRCRGRPPGRVRNARADQPGCTENRRTTRAASRSLFRKAGIMSAHSISKETQGAPDGTWLAFVRALRSIRTLSCPGAARHPGRSDHDDFANALVAHPTLDVTAPVDVTLAGVSGEVHGPPCRTPCARQHDQPPRGPGVLAVGAWIPQWPGRARHLWILDVNGIRVVVQAIDFAGTSAKDQAELRGVGTRSRSSEASAVAPARDTPPHSTKRTLPSPVAPHRRAGGRDVRLAAWRDGDDRVRDHVDRRAVSTQRHHIKRDVQVQHRAVDSTSLPCSPRSHPPPAAGPRLDDAGHLHMVPQRGPIPPLAGPPERPPPPPTVGAPALPMPAPQKGRCRLTADRDPALTIEPMTPRMAGGPSDLRRGHRDRGRNARA